MAWYKGELQSHFGRVASADFFILLIFGFIDLKMVVSGCNWGWIRFKIFVGVFV